MFKGFTESVMMNCFPPPLLGPWYLCRTLKNSIETFNLYLNLTIIVLISICFDFHAFWSLLFFLISPLNILFHLGFRIKFGFHSFDFDFFYPLLYIFLIFFFQHFISFNFLSNFVLYFFNFFYPFLYFFSI